MWKHLTNPDPNIYASDNYVVLDFEATNRDGGGLNQENELILTGWKLGRASHGFTSVTEAYYGSEIPERCLEAIKAADFIVAQASKYELQWLSRKGVDIGRILVWDTLLAEYVRLGNRRGAKDLDSLCRRFGIPVKDKLIKLLMEAGVCPSSMPRRWLTEYNIADVENTEAVFLKQRAELKQFWPHIYTRCLLTPVLADVEKYGVVLDSDLVKEEWEKEDAAYDAATAALAAAHPGVSFTSYPQLGKLLYDELGFEELVGPDGKPDRTDADGRKTDGDTVKALVARTDRQREFKELIGRLAGPSAALTYLEKMWKCCQEAGGKLYARFNQAVTQNHRLSSSGSTYKLQFQNFPRAYKRLFKARFPDWVVGEADGMGMEFRVGAHLGRDPVAVSDIRGKKDVHKSSAAAMFGKPEDRVTKAERQEAKAFTFRPMYYSDGQTKEEKRYAEYFHDRYSAMYATQTEWTYEVLRTKKLVTEWGLVFHWPDCTMSRSGYIKYSTNIANYPISCFATGEIIPIGLVYTWHMMRDAGMLGFIVNTIHDSIIVELPKHEIEVWKKIVDEALTSNTYDYLYKVYGVKMTVPLGVETKFGDHWSEKQYGEFTYELEPSYD